jgi:branched-chain amino acid transport system permease protein
VTRIIEATDIFGGTEGFRGIQGFSSPFLEQYALIAALLLGMFGLRRFLAEDQGLVIRAVKENDQAVRASGISVAWTKTKAVFIASLFGCFAGAYYTHMYGNVGISAFALDLSIMPISATVIGGGGSLAGAVVGSLLLVPLSELLRDFGTLRIVAYALILTGFIVLKSEGIMNFATRKYQQFQRWVEV